MNFPAEAKLLHLLEHVPERQRTIACLARLARAPIGDTRIRLEQLRGSGRVVRYGKRSWRTAP